MFYRPVKQQITLRVDADVVAWFKEHAGENGRGYQTEINKALREHVVRAEEGEGWVGDRRVVNRHSDGSRRFSGRNAHPEGIVSQHPLTPLCSTKGEDSSLRSE